MDPEENLARISSRYVGERIARSLFAAGCGRRLRLRGGDVLM